MKNKKKTKELSEIEGHSGKMTIQSNVESRIGSRNIKKTSVDNLGESESSL